MPSPDPRLRLERMERLERLRSGETRLARVQYQQALAEERTAEDRLLLCQRAYREILADGNHKLQGEVNVRRLPLLQLMVADARRAMEGAERQLQAARASAARQQQRWLAARQEEQIMTRAAGAARQQWQGAVRTLEQKQLDELTILRYGRQSL